jgi:hypothetical protein
MRVVAYVQLHTQSNPCTTAGAHIKAHFQQARLLLKSYPACRCRSPTTTWKEPAAELPDASVALQLTVVFVLAGKACPEAGVQVTAGDGSTLSVAVAV